MSYADKPLSKKLAGIGFDMAVRGYYLEDSDEPQESESGKVNWNNSGLISRPTIAKAADWLREAKGIHVYADPSGDWSVWYAFVSIKNGSGGHLNHQYPTYDVALLAGVEQAVAIVEEREKEVHNG